MFHEFIIRIVTILYELMKESTAFSMVMALTESFDLLPMQRIMVASRCLESER